MMAWSGAGTSSGRSSGTDFAGMLNRHLDPSPALNSDPTWSQPAPQAIEPDWNDGAASSESIEEDHTSCSLSTVPDFVEENDDEEHGDPVVNRGEAPQWTTQQWNDWEDAAGGVDDDDGAFLQIQLDQSDENVFMQLGMSEEAELHNLGLGDQSRRELRGLLREIQQLQEQDEGPEARWALRNWLVRWRHVLGTLQALTDILERRLQPQPACHLPMTREPRIAAQRTRLLGLAGRIVDTLMRIAGDLLAHHRRLTARLPEGVPLPPRPTAPRPARDEGRERSRSREGDRPGLGDSSGAGLESEDEGVAFVQNLNMEETQGLVNHGILGANVSEINFFLSDLALRAGDPQVQPHVRAQAMWSLGVFTRALRGAMRTLSVLIGMLERREVEGAMYLPTDDATRARELAPCRRASMITASIFQQAVNNGLDDAWTHPEGLPPRLQERRRPPRRDPRGGSRAMWMGRALPVEEELREGEEGRGRDRTPRSALERDRRYNDVLAVAAASSGAAPLLERPPLVADNPASEEDGASDDGSGESWPTSRRVWPSTTTTSMGATGVDSTTSSTTCSSTMHSSLVPPACPCVLLEVGCGAGGDEAFSSLSTCPALSTMSSLTTSSLALTVSTTDMITPGVLLGVDSSEVEGSSLSSALTSLTTTSMNTLGTLSVMGVDYVEDGDGEVCE